MRNLTMMTDLYQLTMMDGYYLEGKANQTAVFDLFFRQKDEINYAVFAGLEQAIDERGRGVFAVAKSFSPAVPRLS